MEFNFQKDSELPFSKALSLEWLETNGLGGYAGSSIVNCHTRKYHGLLVSRLKNLPHKYVLLSKIDDVFCQENQEHPLSAHQYSNAAQNGSFENFQKFSLKNHPCFTFQFGSTIITKEILMLHEENTVLIKYRLVNGVSKNTKITIRPLIAYRDFHALTKENNQLNTVPTPCKNGQRLMPYPGLPALYLQSSEKTTEFTSQPVWYKNFHYELEKQRGFEYTEDLFSPGIFTINFTGEEIIFACSLKEIDTDQTLDLGLFNKWDVEIKRRNLLDNRRDQGTTLQRQLKKVGRSFLQKDPETNQYSIVAGYHWFLEWGRDAMIALPGLTLYSGLENECLSILQHFSQYEQAGLIPNFIGFNKEQTAYNTVDASLWFAWAVQQYYAHTKDIKSISNKLWHTLKNIFIHYRDGTSYGIKMTKEGLIHAGSKDSLSNLTWMDSMVDEIPVVQRSGLQVEVNALWYNMLCFMDHLAGLLNDPIEREINPLLNQIKTAFRATFWDENLGYLKDFFNPDNPNDPASLAIRPNQILAVSLPFSPLSPKIMAKVIQVAITHLLTPYGLRSLSSENPNYIGRYAGGPRERDRAYHNGTVWPWLLGHFSEALIRVLQNKKSTHKILRPCLEALTNHLHDAGIGTISEIFSGDEPHTPDGCISQAWSVAEILRATYVIDYK